MGLPSTTAQPKFMFSNDEDSLQIGSFIQQTDNIEYIFTFDQLKSFKFFSKKMGPHPKPPARSTTTESPSHKSNAIESILQMAGLCNGHI